MLAVKNTISISSKITCEILNDPYLKIDTHKKENTNNNNLLHLLFHSFSSHSTPFKKREKKILKKITEKLTEKNNFINEMNSDGMTPLMIACSKQDVR